MQQASGLRPDELTLSCVLRISGEAAAVEIGRQAHGYLIRSSRGGTGRDVVLLSCLVEMYGRCGLAGKARLVFETGGSSREGRRGRDVVLWTSMLNAYGRNGQFDDVIKAFEEMLAERTEPDGLAFLAVLSACSRSGNVKKGLEFLGLMGRSYGLVPGPEHYGCIVDMLCRAGEVEKAWKFANEMVVAGNGKRIGASSWGAILSACRDTGNVEIGVTTARKGLELDPCNVGLLMELSNLYAKVGMWDEIGVLREEMRERGLEKDVGNSRLETSNY
ncbi:pentatricopeptide repeat-containing protein, mitochondrial [Iris pallida]|uniref:Pentatricopeptide repeat-containing protein, mitochondrial n=1 Tax=Iris pallida TaxID=29817 RepID=A0AAX6EU26_IRIPA|nr:pentatricopeptide repeat-containing protein, mitochondrial [Iris pallida]